MTKKLVFVHPEAKAGRRVDLPGLDMEDLKYGQEYEVPAEMAGPLVETGYWTEPQAPAKPAATKKGGEE